MKYFKIFFTAIIISAAVSCNNDNAGEKNGTLNNTDSIATSPHLDTSNRGFVDSARSVTDTSGKGGVQ